MADIRRELGPWTTLLVRLLDVAGCATHTVKVMMMALHKECYLGVIVDNHNKQLLKARLNPTVETLMLAMIYFSSPTLYSSLIYRSTVISKGLGFQPQRQEHQQEPPSVG
jgi:hypothetical protein